ncbi:GNAT family N-acetyltransferase [Paenibacillus sp. UNC451MF]|uniref:GNAT family N-acetyltransferase n=1 Tax=Paenibacillus sp. UNC451MF TaxID=1449063 RepID=UPI00048D9773|nr:GNAT family N-acetyltransferase [Paenibacillus sp. UNC451MF]
MNDELKIGERRHLIKLLEQLSFNTWPAAICHPYGDWKVRISDGTTKRANSVWTSSDGFIPECSTWMNDVGSFYKNTGLPLIFQLNEISPMGLDSELEEQGFSKEAASTVFIANTSQVIESTRNDLHDHSLTFTVQEQHDDIWLSNFMEAEGFDSKTLSFYDRIFTAIEPTKGFVSLYMNNRCVALGTSIVEKDWAGIINVVVHPSLRRQGMGRSLIHQLACWSAHKRASSMYLQVVDGNTPATNLYRSSGFSPFYKYHYRVEPTQDK